MSKHSNKLIADEVPVISVYYLNQVGVFNGGGQKHLTITMENGLGNTCRVSASFLDSVKMILDYYTSGFGPREDIKIEVHLITQQCNLGGHRFWFLCPCCSHRVGKLYLFGKYFVCRACSDLTYLSKNMNRRCNSFILYNCLKMENHLNELVKTITKTKYRNRITKRYQRCLDLHRKIHQYDDLMEKISKYPQIYLR